MCKARFPDTDEQGLPRASGGRVVATEGRRAPLEGGPGWGVALGMGRGARLRRTRVQGAEALNG